MLFDEIYSSYYHTVALILAEAVKGTLNNQKMRQIIRQNSSAESIAVIPDAFQKGRWPLLDQHLHTPLRHVPERSLTIMEKRWLKAVLQDPRLQLFGVDETGLEDVKPLFNRSFFVYYDQYSDGDPYTDPVYIQHFHVLLQAWKEKKPVIMDYAARRKNMHVCVMIDHLEYSQKEDQFRIAGLSQEGLYGYYNAARIRNIQIGNAWHGQKAAAPMKRKVLLAIKDERRALERAMLSFSDLEKVTVPMGEDRYQMELSYRQEDETEILIRILAFGPMLKVIGPEDFAAKIRARIEKQKNI